MTADRNQTQWSVASLAITAFAIGAAEFIVVGVLPAISLDLHVSLARAGSLIGIYAFALAIGTPITVLLTSRYDRKPLLIGLVLVFLAGNVGAALSHDIETLLVARVLTAVAHGSFFAIGASVAARLAKPGQASRAIAMMFAGHTLAMVVGVPLGTYVGNLFGWRLPFLLIAAVAFISALAIAKWLPSVSTSRPTSVASQLMTIRNPAILTMMAVTILGFGASFAPFSFITPILVNVAGFTTTGANLMLVVFGLATLFGNSIGGAAAARIGWFNTLKGIFALLAVSLAAIALFVHSSVPLACMLFVWGGLAFGMSPACQAAMLSTAEAFTPRAIDFASSLNISAFNLGITLGETTGGFMVAREHLSQTPLLGMVLVIGATVPLNYLAKLHTRY
ncbi:MFS transporter [Paraburkholderia silvatlantica]|uniref:Multidrug resistance protein n=1 Tax=Paraburkholderia silvatlantica TaxID=321895 RepID=A0A2U1A9I4_9BURK|nr:MFS transporter [Paraburkholderia silvatlantica]MBB2930524.1 multidrug resistance protein [Paraburkholderia silvatlantica]PVY30331.1 multidrug resistance protein [Paraburkholderia silvatlantica]PXW36932.1 multidrug resistance protein [Paraburkholderia silvatlantica]PYE21272.1 multidrug resistance protein [Paraburkholderia silvatlantica]TDQ86587.1 multidrug resistance protein [Paraburkholderia silvatlantica]